MLPQRGSLTCEFCGELFQRREHLNRHQLRHSGLRPFRCTACAKSFSRRDSLVRHWAIHRTENGPPPYHGRRTPQACLRCARLKQRCEGGLPCPRCVRQHGRCEYRQGPAPSGAREVSTPRASVEENVDYEAAADAFEQADTSSAEGRRTHPREPFISLPASSSLQLPPDPPSIVTRTAEDSAADPSSCELVSSIEPRPSSTSDPASWTIDYSMTGTSLSSVVDVDDQFPFEWLGPCPLGFPFWPMGEVDDLHTHHSLFSGEAGFVPQERNSDGAPRSDRAIPEVHQTISHPSDEANELPVDGGYQQSPRPRPKLNGGPCPEFPVASPEQLQVAETEVFGHITQLPEHSIQDFRSFYHQQCETTASTFISTNILHAFVELYLEYADHTFPFLHISTVRRPDLPWILLVGIATVGGQYSHVPDAHQYCLVLQELLGRAIQAHTPPRAKLADLAVVQSLLLRHVLLFASGSRLGHVLLQFERNMLVSALHALHAVRPHNQLRAWVSYREVQDQPDEWRAWVAAEEMVRLSYCVHALECLQFVFWNLPPLFTLSNFVRSLPCSDAAWQCQSAEEWRQHRIRSSGESPQPGAMQLPKLGRFIQRIQILELFTDSELRMHHAHSSRVLRSLFALHTGVEDRSRRPSPGSSFPSTPGRSATEVQILDELLDTGSYAQLSHRQAKDFLVHVLTILRHVPLVTLYRATGWETDEAGMAKAKVHVFNFFRHNRTTALKCLWHAAIIFTDLSNVHFFACYDAFNLCIAVCYIGVFIDFDRDVRGIRGPNGARHGSAIVRLDTLATKAALEKWIRSGGIAEIHITGIGLLSGSNTRLRLLNDAIKTLKRQPAWSGLCQGLASTFVKLKSGEMPRLEPE